MLYWLELNEPLGSHRKQSSLYLGYARDDVRLERRIMDHARGRGAAFTKAAFERGIGFQVVGVCDGTRDDERRLKNRKNHRRELERLKNRGLIRVPSWLLEIR